MRRQQGELGLLALHRLRVRLPAHLDVPERPFAAVPGEVEVVQAEGLLEHRVVALLAQGDHGLAVVVHVVAADLARAVGQAIRVPVGSRPEQDGGAVGGPGRDRHDVGLVDLLAAAPADHHGRDGSGRPGPCLEALDFGVDQQGDVRLVQDRAHGDDVGVGLGVYQARVAITPGTADALAGRPVRLVEQDAAGRVERVVARSGQGVGDLLDPRLVRHRRPRVLLRAVALGGILAVHSVDLVEPLGLGVPRLELVIGQRPGGRDAVGVLELAEIPGPQPVQRGAVELGGAADEVVHLRLERLPVGVVPGVGRDVLAVHEHRAGIPVVHLAGQEIAPFEQQDPLAGRGQRVGQRAAAGAGAHDDHVIVLSHIPILEAHGREGLTRRG